MNKIKGSQAGQWGQYEALRLWGSTWPMLLGVGVSVLGQLGADVGAGVSVPAGMAIGLVAKGLQQWLTNNSGKTL